MRIGHALFCYALRMKVYIGKSKCNKTCKFDVEKTETEIHRLATFKEKCKCYHVKTSHEVFGVLQKIFRFKKILSLI